MTVYDVGDTARVTLTVDPFDGTTAVTLTLTAPDGATSNPAVTSLGSGAYEALAKLTTAGTWVAGWTVTGTGAGVEHTVLHAEEPPPLSDGMRQLRLLIADTDPANRIFRASELGDFLALEDGDVRLAAAQALDTIAASEALVSKKIRTQDLSTDGPAVAKELRARAAALRKQVDEGAGLDGGGFDIVYWPPQRRL